MMYRLQIQVISKGSINSVGKHSLQLQTVDDVEFNVCKPASDLLLLRLID